MHTLLRPRQGRDGTGLRQGLPDRLDPVRRARRAGTRARGRAEQLHEEGLLEARLYGGDPNDGVGGFGAFFLLLDDPEVYGLPPDPVVPTRRLPEIWGAAFLAGAALAAGVVAAVAGGRG